MDKTGDRQAVFQFFVFHTVPAEQHRVCFLECRRAAGEDFPQWFPAHARHRIGHDVHGGFRNAAHRIDVGEGVCSGNAAEIIRIVDDWRKEIQGLDQGQFIGHTIDPGIIRGCHADQNVFICRKFNAAECLFQVPWREFRCSATSLHAGGESNHFILHFLLL